MLQDALKRVWYLKRDEEHLLKGWGKELGNVACMDVCEFHVPMFISMAVVIK